MNVFKRIFKIGQAEAHSIVDKIEDPIKLTEQGIRDMKNDLDKSLEALAQVKALAIRAKNDGANYSRQAAEYEKKAVLLLQRAQSGDMPTEEADRLASEALMRKDQAEKQAATEKANKEKFDQNITQMDANIKTLRSNISKWENELKTLKARHRVSTATKSLNKQLAQIDSGSTVSMLERMKEKVDKQESLSEAYGEIANESKSLDEEIDKALDGSSVQASADLAALKSKLGISTGVSAPAEKVIEKDSPAQQ